LNDSAANLHQGEDIAVFGFPLSELLSSGGNLTVGVVSAITGLGNNTNQIQITASIQPGSSGSPVLNRKGEVVGMVSMKLSDLASLRSSGQIGQNVNFAVSGQTLITFLKAHRIDYDTGGFFSFRKSNADLAKEATKWTLPVECWK
jgi:S1-C subfamily serine protease